jgi:hypothetical protein
MNGQPHNIAPGSAVFIPANVEHGVRAGADGLKFAYGFGQNVQPKTELFRDRYRRRVHARCLPPDENSMDNVCNTSLPIR